MDTYNETLRAQLAAWKESEQLTDADLGRQLGFTATRINKFLNLNKEGHKPEPDVPEIERRAADLLKNAPRRKANKVALFSTDVSERIRAVLESIRKTNDVGLIHGPAGVGKTCAANIYVDDHPTAVLITVLRWRRTADAVIGLLFGAVDHTTWKGNQSRSEWLENWFRGSNRLLVVDNAHKLSPSGLEFLFDFHDSTSIPIALIGNPEVLRSISKNDQWFSRIGMVREVKMAKDTAPLAHGLVKQLTPDSGDELYCEAEDVVAGRGHARTLKKQLVLTKELKTGHVNWLTAFKAAGTQLVKGTP